MRARRALALVGIGLALCVGLAGCSAASSTPTTAPSDVQSAGTTTSSTPTPMATAESASPAQVFDGDCSSLATLSTVLAATPKLTLQPQSAPPYLYSVPLPQTGGIDCEWRDAQKIGGYGVSVLPDAAASFAAASADLKAYDDELGPARVKNVPHYGDTSYTQCLSTGDDPAYGCTFDILVGTTWIHVDKNDATIIKAYPESAGLKKLLTTIVANVRALPATAPWTAPTDGITVPTECPAALSTATLQKDLRLTMKLNPLALINGPFDKAVVAQTGSLKCQWGSKVVSPTRTTIQLTAVPGSGWAWPGDVPPKSASSNPLKPLSGLGDAAVAGCHTSECDVIVRAGRTWFELDDIRAGGTASLADAVAVARSFLTGAAKG